MEQEEEGPIRLNLSQYLTEQEPVTPQETPRLNLSDRIQEPAPVQDTREIPRLNLSDRLQGAPEPQVEMPTFNVSDRLQETEQEPVEPRVVRGNNGLYDIDAIVQEYGRPLLKDDFLEDERLQDILVSVMEARRGTDRSASSIRDLATGAAGGATFGQDYRNMDPEELFETWQNYQRSFAAGQSVTVANEIAFSLEQDDETLARLGSGYLLFDAMDNAFTGEGSWREMGDAVWDYTRSVVWDPTTLVSFGVGRALSGGATKASSAAARNVMLRAYRRALSRGAAGRAALSTVGAAAGAAPFIAPDLALNVGLDIAQQSQLIRTGAQEEYSGARTALAAAGTMAIPALLAGARGVAALRSGPLRNTWVGSTDLSYLERTMTQDQAWAATAQRVDRDKIIDFSSNNFGRLEGNPSLFLDWADAKIVANEIVDENGERLTDNQVMNMFERYFWFGDPGRETEGYFTTLRDAGFVVHPSMLENNTISGVYGQAITLMSDEAAERVVRSFEDATGRNLGITPTADGLAAHFISRSSEAGETLGIRSQLSRWERMGLSGRELAEATAGTGQQATGPRASQYVVSVYKRLLTSHLATTGANIAGFGSLVSIDTLADFASSAIYATQSAAYRVFSDNPDMAARFARQARAGLYTPFRRAAGAISPQTDLEYATRILEMNPEAQERLFREISGDSGPNQALAQYNLEGNRLAEGVDAITRGAQTLTLVRLQDDLTKRWAFAANLDREILREYGMTAQQFWARDDASIDMASETFQGLLDRAVFRTQRQTASVNWSTLPGRNGMRWAARTFESGINNQFGGAFGYIIPFPGFMNTTVATLGDLSGVNATRRLLSAARGTPMDYADQDFGELMGKFAAGIAIVGYGVSEAIDRVQSGYSWNQDVDQATGVVEDRTFDWPSSTLRLTSQMIAHALVGENVSSDPVELAAQLDRGEVSIDLSQIPADLQREFILQAGPGQAMRDFDGALQAVREAWVTALENPEEFGGELVGLVQSTLARVGQGFTRPLDPINTAVGLARGGNMNPDLRQGSENVNQAMRYINQLLPSVSGVDDLPRRATATRGTEGRVDLGRQLLGNRTSGEPNVAEAMFNAAGIPSWRAVRWNGPPEVRNYMDNLAFPIFERESVRALQRNPNYFSMSTDEKELILGDIRSRVRSYVMDMMNTRGVPRTLDAARRLAGENQQRVNRVISELGYEGELSDILQREDGFEALSRIQYFVDNYDQIFHGDLDLSR